jgi:hypothetical protein
MTEEEFRNVYLTCSAEVADKFYPKGQTGQRGEYLRDQGVLYALLQEALQAKGLFDEH